MIDKYWTFINVLVLDKDFFEIHTLKEEWNPNNTFY